MYKFKLLAITAIAVIGALLIYNHFDNIKQEEPVVDKFVSEYNLVSENHIFKYRTIDEILNILDTGTGFIFLCTPESDWCNHYAKNLNDILKELNVQEINYYNIKTDRELNTLKYQKVLDKLSPYLYKDDENNSKLYMPDLTVVKNGEIVAHDNETSVIESDKTEESYWTQERINEFKNKLYGYVNLLNN